MKIVVVGGGTAGWISTFFLAKLPDVEVVNVSSKEIPIIGVGEGTTALFTTTLAKHFNPVDLIKGVDGLPKLGIQFKNWGGDWFSPIDGSDTRHFFIDYSLYAKPCSDHTYMADIHRTNIACVRINDGEKQLIVKHPTPTAMHIDAYSTVEFLKEHSLKAGVNYIESTVKSVNTQNNKIQSIVLDDGVEIEGDLFVDCSGFNRILSRELEDTGWTSYSDYLPVNKALTYTYDEDDYDLFRDEYTTAEAMDNGWTWTIPTRNKVGRGYVYCDKFATEDDIVKELEQKHDAEITVQRSIPFDSGRINKFLNGNCYSVGLSAGFLEPLQATSLHCALFQLDYFVYDFLSDAKLLDNPFLVREHNERMSRLYDETRDFVAMHYTGGKTNTDFWKYVLTMDKPQRVKELLHLAEIRAIRSFDFDKTLNVYGQESFNPVLLGLSHFNSEVVQKVLVSDGTTVAWWRQAVQNYEAELDKKVKDNLSAQALNNILLETSDV